MKACAVQLTIVALGGWPIFPVCIATESVAPAFVPFEAGHHGCRQQEIFLSRISALRGSWTRTGPALRGQGAYFSG